MTDLILALDQGTTGSRAFVLDRSLKVLGHGYREFPQLFPQPGWVEHNLDDIWTSLRVAIEKALATAKVRGHDIACIGITNQRETVALWERDSLRAIHNAIVWQCRRTEPFCAKLRKAGHEPAVKKATGLVLDPYFSGTKIRWLLDNVEGAKKRARTGELAVGTIDTFVMAKLTGGYIHATDPSNASRTLLYNLKTRSWDADLLDLFGVPAELLPEIKPSAGHFGETRGLDFLPDGIPITGVAGDQQSALFGQACFTPGEAKCTFGTGAFMMMNTGDKPKVSRTGLLTTVAWELPGEFTYALEGSAFIAGAAVQWLRDGMKLIDSSAESEALAGTVPDSGGVIFVPALSGLGAPYWRADARGLITGITRGTTRAHIARAVLEGVAWQNSEILTAMQKDAGKPLSVLKVDGGATANNLLMQMQADALGTPIVRPAMLETTVLGAASLAALGHGLFKSKAQIRSSWSEGARFKPKMKPATRAAFLKLWKAAVAKA
jgi:glycerol kinase